VFTGQLYERYVSTFNNYYADGTRGAPNDSKLTRLWPGVLVPSSLKSHLITPCCSISIPAAPCLKTFADPTRSNTATRKNDFNFGATIRKSKKEEPKSGQRPGYLTTPPQSVHCVSFILKDHLGFRLKLEQPHGRSEPALPLNLSLHDSRFGRFRRRQEQQRPRSWWRHCRREQPWGA
jgi:hypothetical protein